jgi:hypothetical protein
LRLYSARLRRVVAPHALEFSNRTMASLWPMDIGFGVRLPGHFMIGVRA